MKAGTIVTQQMIRAEREVIGERLLSAQNDLAALQKRCEHPNATKVANSSTGNWCKADDAYWYECKCHDCGKFWTEPQ